MNKNNLERIEQLKQWVFSTWRTYPPEWFITLCWNDLPTCPIQVEKYSRRFRNVFLSKLYDLNSPRKLKSLPFPNRVGMVVFNERKDVYNGVELLYKNPKSRQEHSLHQLQHWNSTRRLMCFHTHIHLFNSGGLFPTSFSVEEFIREKCFGSLPTLLKRDQVGNKGVVVLKWIQNRHFTYNFKDLFTYRDQQDGDLLMDYKSTDLLPNRNL